MAEATGRELCPDCCAEAHTFSGECVLADCTGWMADLARGNTVRYMRAVPKPPKRRKKT